MDDLVERLRGQHQLNGGAGAYAWTARELCGLAAYRIQALEARIAELQPVNARWPIGAKVRKKRGSSWRGTVVGYYSTPHTPIGYCVDSAFEPGRAALARSCVRGLGR